MIIFISGSVNSGKTTTARALAKKLGAVHIDGDEINHSIPNFDLATDIPRGIALTLDKINSLVQQGQSVVVSHVIGAKDYKQIIAGLGSNKAQFFTLAPRLEVAQSPRGDRQLTEWETERVKYHYDTGIASPSFGQIIDNSDLSVDEVVAKIVQLLPK